MHSVETVTLKFTLTSLIYQAVDLFRFSKLLFKGVD